MVLAAIEGGAGKGDGILGAGGWLAVVESAVGYDGIDPAVRWVEALVDAGSEEGKLASDGRNRTTRCPVDGHNGGKDEKGSLTWRVSEDGGRVVFSCKGGCEGGVVLEALRLKTSDLKWGKTYYNYLTEARDLTSTSIHKRTWDKRFSWLHYDPDPALAAQGETQTGKAAGWPEGGLLWLWPDLLEAAEKARAEGVRVELILCEGEKDTTSVSRTLGWAGQGTVAWRVGVEQEYLTLVSTSGDGAAKWDAKLSQDVARLVGEDGRVVVLADGDAAGRKRGDKILHSLIEHGGLVEGAVGVWGWVGGDASDAIEKYGRAWGARAELLAEVDAYRFASHKTGWLCETEIQDEDGAGTGERALARMVEVKTGKNAGTRRAEVVTTMPVRVAGLMVDDGGEVAGWLLGLGPDEAGLVKEAPLLLRDLRIGGGLGGWNAEWGLFISSTRGLAEPFRAWLAWHQQKAPVVRYWDHEGWVTREDGSRAFIVSRESALAGGGWGGGVLVSVGGSGQEGGVGGEAGVSDERVSGGVADLWAYGVVRTEEEVLETLCEILTYRDIDEAAPVLGWLCAVATKPWALEVSGGGGVSLPMLQVVGTSGTGKTSWLGLACGLFGLRGAAGAFTPAALMRGFGSTTAAMWPDDANLEAEGLSDLIRQMLTNGSRVRGNIDGSRGVTTDIGHAALITSAETGYRLNETAIKQRSAVVRFDKSVQGRKSVRAGSAGRVAQIVDVNATAAKWGRRGEGAGTGLASGAGTLMQIVGRLLGDEKEVAGWRAKLGGSDGVRGAAGYRATAWGSMVLAGLVREAARVLGGGRLVEIGLLWEEELAEAGGDAVRGVEKVCAEIEAVALDWSDRGVEAAVKGERAGADHYLVRELLPRYLKWSRDKKGTGWGRGQGVRVWKGEQDEGAGLGVSLRPAAVREALRGAVEAEKHWSGRPAVVLLVGVDAETGAVLVETGEDGETVERLVGMAVSPKALYLWASGGEGLQAGVSRDARQIGEDAIAKQLSDAAKGAGGELLRVSAGAERLGYRVLLAGGDAWDSVMSEGGA